MVWPLVKLQTVKSGPAICQSCGTIVRGKAIRCLSCQNFISKYSPTPLSTFTLKESAPIGFVTFRTDHLLLERVLTISQTDKLIWQSPCKHGECIHADKLEKNDSEQKREEKGKEDVDDIKGVSESPESPVESAEEPRPSRRRRPGQESEYHLVRGCEDGRFSSWTLSISGISPDGIAKGIELAMEDVDSQPLPASQSFSATTLVFGSALDERVIAAEPQDLIPFYEQSLKEHQSVKSDSKKEPEKTQTPEYKEPSVFVGTFDEVDRTASAIFDPAHDDLEAQKFKDALKDAIELQNEDSKPTSSQSDNGDQWPDDGYQRGQSGKDSSLSSDSKKRSSPYQSQFDLSAIKRPSKGDSNSSERFDKAAMFGKKGSLLGILLKIVAVTLVFVTIGCVGLFFLAGGQPSVTDGGVISQNEQGLPVLSGNWKLTLWVETASGNAGYGEVSAIVVQKGDKVTGQGEDVNGKFFITGSIGQEEKVMIAFAKHYDTSDGRQHPYPTRFSGVVGPTQGSHVVAEGSFADRLMQDMPELEKNKFEQIQGYWSLSLVEETLIDKLKAMMGI